METVALTFVWLAQIYLLLGLLFAVVFVTRGAHVIDPAAKGAGWGFRLILLPGVAAFWPLLLWRWLRKAPPPEERNAHRDAAGREKR